MDIKELLTELLNKAAVINAGEVGLKKEKAQLKLPTADKNQSEDPDATKSATEPTNKKHAKEPGDGLKKHNHNFMI